MFLKVGVYDDKVSLARAEPLLRMIRQAHPDVQVEKKVFSHRMADGGPGAVVVGLNRRSPTVYPRMGAVLENKADFGILNMKDLPIFSEPTNIVIAATPERSSPYDALVTRDQSTLKSLKLGSTVGASTLLRMVQLRKMRPDLKVEAVSGSVEERLSRLDRGELDGVILAESGLARLGLSNRIAQRLPIDDFMPMPGQGMTVLVCRRDNQKAARLVRSLDNERTRREGEAERELVRLVREKCKVPLGAYASTSGDKIHLTACIVSSDGGSTIRASEAGPANEPLQLAQRVADSLFRQGALSLEDGWRKLYPLYDD